MVAIFSVNSNPISKSKTMLVISFSVRMECFRCKQQFNYPPVIKTV